MSIRVLVADDQEIVRTGLRMILDAQPGIEVVAVAADGEEAIRLAHQERPDVCLVAIRMPAMAGLEHTQRLAGPGVPDPIPVVVITTFDLDEYVYTALRNGARGFLLKNAGPVLLAEAIHAAARGDAMIDPSVTVRLIEAFAGSSPRAGRSEAVSELKSPTAPLTAREEDVLDAVARGQANTEIARDLYISLSTVKTHIASLMTKLDVRNRVELAIWAAERARTHSSRRQGGA